jgi:hypothetical protein
MLIAATEPPPRQYQLQLRMNREYGCHFSKSG